jgi:hypothetical protein
VISKANIETFMPLESFFLPRKHENAEIRSPDHGRGRRARRGVSPIRNAELVDSERSDHLWFKAFSRSPERVTAIFSQLELIFPYFSTLLPSKFLAWLSFTMMPLRPSKSALRTFHLQRHIAGRRPFSTSFVASAASPHRSSVQKRGQSTATAPAGAS